MKEKLLGKKYLPHRTVIGFVLGIVAGLLFKDFSVWVLPFGTAFMNLIKMLIVPVIFFSLVSGISAIGVFALMANTTAVYGAQLFGNLAKFVLTDYISCLTAWFAFSLFVKYYTGIRYGRMCKAMIPIWINTVATNSSAGTIPITMDVTTNRMGLPFDLTSFSIPLGATINLCGAAIYKTILAFFVAEIYGLTLSVGQIAMVISISTLMSIAAPGIPGGGIVTGAIFLNLLNLPMDLMGPIAGMYKLIDMSHTTLNVSGDVLGTLFVAKNEKIWDAKRFNETKGDFAAIDLNN